jgi:hypothetical protein
MSKLVPTFSSNASFSVIRLYLGPICVGLPRLHCICTVIWSKYVILCLQSGLFRCLVREQYRRPCTWLGWKPSPRTCRRPSLSEEITRRSWLSTPEYAAAATCYTLFTRRLTTIPRREPASIGRPPWTRRRACQATSAKPGVRERFHLNKICAKSAH